MKSIQRGERPDVLQWNPSESGDVSAEIRVCIREIFI